MHARAAGTLGLGRPEPYRGRIARSRAACRSLPQTVTSASQTKDMSTALSLSNIRSTLIRLEDTIIFNFIERAQFARNEPVYVSDHPAIPVPGFDRNGRRYSLLEYVLRQTEQLHGSVRRYTSPDEHAFFHEDVPTLVLPPISYPPVLHSCESGINLNAKVMDAYINNILPGLTAPGDDNNYGSAATLDVLCLQALSKRIHYGKFVAEAKFQAKTEQYSQLIRAGDAEGIMALLTDKEVERRVMERVALKAATFGQDLSDPSAAANGGNGQAAPKLKVAPELVARVYEEVVMPLTKEVEVIYLLRRLD